MIYIELDYEKIKVKFVVNGYMVLNDSLKREI